MNELEQLIPQGIDVLIGEETISVLPLKVGQMPAFLRAITPVMRYLDAAEIDWLQLFGERGDDLLNAVAIAVNRPRAWVEDLAADEAIILAAKVIEVNADFFTRVVAPRLDGLFAEVKALAPTSPPTPTGSTPSST